MRSRCWLRHYATRRKVVSSIPDEVIRFSVELILPAALWPYGPSRPVTGIALLLLCCNTGGADAKFAPPLAPSAHGHIPDDSALYSQLCENVKHNKILFARQLLV
jgi:hypothetical protein